MCFEIGIISKTRTSLIVKNRLSRENKIPNDRLNVYLWFSWAILSRILFSLIPFFFSLYLRYVKILVENLKRLGLGPNTTLETVTDRNRIRHKIQQCFLSDIVPGKRVRKKYYRRHSNVRSQYDVNLPRSFNKRSLIRVFDNRYKYLLLFR